MKYIIVILLFALNTTFALGQVDKELRPYVKQYNDSLKPHLSNKNFRSIIKVEFSELYGDWKTHRHYNGWHIIINPKCKDKRTAVMQALDAAHFKLITKKEVL